MSKPFQISIRRMLCAIACICVASRSFVLLADHVYRKSPVIEFLLLFVFCFSASGATRAMAGSVIRWTVLGFICFFLWLAALLVAMPSVGS